MFGLQVVYYCFGGAHSSVVAAAIHMGTLPLPPEDGARVGAWPGEPSVSQLLSLPRFDQTRAQDMGVPYYMGQDDRGNEVYALGVGPAKELATGIMRELLEALGADAQQLVMVPTLPAIGILTRIGGFTSRSLGLTFVGRPLVALGILRDYRALAARVAEARSGLGFGPLTQGG